MTRRAVQREKTRESIVSAAVEAFSELGFHGASTRDIAARAGTNQGLITYHFRTKEDLWKAAVDSIFSLLRDELRPPGTLPAEGDPRERIREGIRRYVRFAAAHPEFFRLMVEEGRTTDPRMQWLVDTHLSVFYAGFERIRSRYGGRTSGKEQAHYFYALAGAASLIFAVAPECRRLTGLDPTRKKAVEAHVEYVVRLFSP